MREKKEARSSPKSDWLRKMREQRYEEQQQRGRDAKAKPTEKEHPAVVAARNAPIDSEPETDEEHAAVEEAKDEWHDLEAESRKAKKGKR